MMELLFENSNLVCNIALLFCMIQLHIVDDYILQGVLAHMKQKNWWKDNYPQELYRKDYIVALTTHAFSWAFMIMIVPVAKGIYTDTLNSLHVIVFITNWVVHALVDDLKANKFKINLLQDQVTHIVQILITWALLVIL